MAAGCYFNCFISFGVYVPVTMSEVGKNLLSVHSIWHSSENRKETAQNPHVVAGNSEMFRPD